MQTMSGFFFFADKEELIPFGPLPWRTDVPALGCELVITNPLHGRRKFVGEGDANLFKSLTVNNFTVHHPELTNRYLQTTSVF